MPEGGGLRAGETRLPVHPELDAIDPGKHLDKLCQGGIVIGDQVLGGDARDEVLDPFSGRPRCARDPAALHLASVDMVPDADCHADAPRVGDLNHTLEGRGVFRLPLRPRPHQLDIRKPIDSEEIRIDWGHEPAVLVAEDDHETVDAAGGQEVKVTLPVALVKEALLEPATLHGVHRHGSFLHLRRFAGLADFRQGCQGVGFPTNLFRDVQQGVHQAPFVRAADQEYASPAPSHVSDQQGFRRLWGLKFYLAKKGGRRTRSVGESGYDERITPGSLERGGQLLRYSLLVQRQRHLAQTVSDGGRRQLIGDHRNDHRPFFCPRRAWSETEQHPRTYRHRRHATQ